MYESIIKDHKCIGTTPGMIGTLIRIGWNESPDSLVKVVRNIHLCGLIRLELNQDPLSDSLFVFCNRYRNRVKLIYWDSDGLAIYDLNPLCAGIFSKSLKSVRTETIFSPICRISFSRIGPRQFSAMAR